MPCDVNVNVHIYHRLSVSVLFLISPRHPFRGVRAADSMAALTSTAMDRGLVVSTRMRPQLAVFTSKQQSVLVPVC